MIEARTIDELVINDIIDYSGQHLYFNLDHLFSSRFTLVFRKNRQDYSS